MSRLEPSEAAPGLLLGEGVQLGEGVEIGGNVVIHAGTRVGNFCEIGDWSPLSPPMPYVLRSSGYTYDTVAAPTGTAISCANVR